MQNIFPIGQIKWCLNLHVRGTFVHLVVAFNGSSPPRPMVCTLFVSTVAVLADACSLTAYLHRNDTNGVQIHNLVIMCDIMEQRTTDIGHNTVQLSGNKEERRTKPKDDDDSGIILPGLPNEIASYCLGRIPQLLYPRLKAVSRAWRFHLSSQILTPSNPNASHGLPKNYVYVQVCSTNFQISVFAWNLQQKICLALPPFPVHLRSGMFAVASGKLFCVGTEAWAYDPYVNGWNSIPPPKVRRRRPAVGCIDGKIYVLGGCRAGSSDWAEVYDPAVGLWNPVLSHSGLSITNEYCRDCVVVNGKLYGMSYGGLGFVFDPSWSALTVVTMDAYKKMSHARGHVNTPFFLLE